jgi:alpha-D-xyloside xylohydrolase
MAIHLDASDIVHIQYSILRSLDKKKSLIVQNTGNKHTAFHVSDSTGAIRVTTPRLTLTVNKETNAITYAGIDGTVILAEDPAAGKTMTAATIAGIQTFTCTTRFLSSADEGLYGLGCHPEDTLAMNYKGRDQELAIRYLTGAVPVLVSTHGYGLMWDNYSASRFSGTVAANTKYEYVSESGTMIDYYFFYGPDLDHVIASYRKTTGEAPMFPKWSFGLIQSQDRYKSQAEVLSVKDSYRANKIPVDCIVQDWFYWEPNVIGSHVMYPERYPNPRHMIDELHAANIHAMISIWPVFAEGTTNFDELKAGGGLTSLQWKNVMTKTNDTYYDVTNPAARELYWKQTRDGLIARHGWDAWWVDQCEPDVTNDIKLDPADERRMAMFAIGRGIDYFNTYSLMHTSGLYEHWRRDIVGKRAFFLVRQAFAGQQRNATTLWSSDITCTFRALKSQVPQAINACASGIPYWTSDIGGYHFHWNAPDWSMAENRELFTRWFQFGTFCPIFRIHGKGERALYSDNWDEHTKSILLTYDKLRYRLMPYIYSLAWKVTSEGSTIMRPLAFDFRTDPHVAGISDQYMFGPAILVNPVTEQMNAAAASTAGANFRQVYLPASTVWYDFWTGDTITGGRVINAAAPIETIPLYVKAGSIIPIGPVVQYATEQPAAPLEVRVYPGADGQFTLYEDENDGYGYEKKQYSTITFTWYDKLHTLLCGSRQGTYHGMVASRVFTVVVVAPGQGNDSSGNIGRMVAYTGARVTVKM